MKKYNYDYVFATGTAASAGTLRLSVRWHEVKKRHLHTQLRISFINNHELKRQCESKH